MKQRRRISPRAAAALKSSAKTAGEIALILGEGLQSFCIPGSVSSERRIGLGHSKLASMILSEDVKCFCFLAGHESFAAAEGALGIARSANQARQTPIRVILNGMGKDAADIIARINGFTYVRTHFDFAENKLYIDEETPYSTDERADVRCYGAFEPREGIAIMTHEQVDVSISGNATHMIRFQHPVAGAYKKYCSDNGKRYFACASGGGIGRTLNPDDTPAGPSSYGQTDLLWPDRSHEPHVRRCDLRGLILGPGACGNDGLHRHGQQSHGRRDSRHGRPPGIAAEREVGDGYELRCI